MAKILLTGGAGFIGSHLAERLLNDGHQLCVVDDFNDFYSPATKRRNLAAIPPISAFELLEADIRDPLRMEEAFAHFAPEIVIHLAARAGVRPSLEQPLLYEQTNVGGTLLLLELARKHRIHKFVFASSSSVYGSTERVPFSEDACDPTPISPYGVSKLAGEKLCSCYAKLYGVSSICLRFFTAYGPRQRPDLAIHKFAQCIVDDREIPFFGDGNSLRDYTYVDDLVDGIHRAMQLQSPFEIINLGNSHPIPLSKMVHLLEQKLGKAARLKKMNAQLGDMLSTHADLSKARRLLGYSPKVSFEEGLDRFVSWFRNEKG
ncbi:MAG: GDP-mannose 4,6-dehydratase [Terriglobia bacterium]